MTAHAMFRNTALVAVFAVATAIATPALADGPHRGYASGHARGHSGGHANVYFVYRSCGRPYVSSRYGYDRGHRFNRRVHRGSHWGSSRYYGRPGYGQRYLRHSDGRRDRTYRGNRSHRDRAYRSHRDRSRHGRRCR